MKEKQRPSKLPRHAGIEINHCDAYDDNNDDDWTDDYPGPAFTPDALVIPTNFKKKRYNGKKS